jgi:DNA-binding LytR/AlgR family response regulator
MTTATEENSCKTVFVLDDSELFQETVLFGLEDRIKNGEIRLLQATSIVEGFTLFDKNINSIDLVFVDGCVPGQELNTTEFLATTATDRNNGICFTLIALRVIEREMTVIPLFAMPA